MDGDKLFGELPAYAGFYFKENIEYDPEAARRDFIPENQPRLARLCEVLATLEPFEADAIGATFKSVAQALGVKTGVLVHPAGQSANASAPARHQRLAPRRPATATDRGPAGSRDDTAG